MKIPSNIKIAGMNWKVKLSKPVTDQGHCFGSTHLQSEEIYLDPQTSQQRQEETFLHELLHVAYYNTGLYERFKEQKSEEEVVSALSAALYPILKDNNLLK